MASSTERKQKRNKTELLLAIVKKNCCFDSMYDVAQFADQVASLLELKEKPSELYWNACGAVTADPATTQQLLAVAEACMAQTPLGPDRGANARARYEALMQQHFILQSKDRELGLAVQRVFAKDIAFGLTEMPVLRPPFCPPSYEAQEAVQNELLLYGCHVQLVDLRTLPLPSHYASLLQICVKYGRLAQQDKAEAEVSTLWTGLIETSKKCTMLQQWRKKLK